MKHAFCNVRTYDAVDQRADVRMVGVDPALVRSLHLRVLGQVAVYGIHVLGDCLRRQLYPSA
jgi:hypothetical protein